MTATTVSASEEQALWDYVPLADYSVPAAPVAHTVNKGLSAIRKLFRDENAKSGLPLKSETDLRSLSERQLATIAPAPVWDDAAAALHTALGTWLTQKESTAPILLLVGPPYSGHAGILRAWAEQKAKGIIEPPSPEQILAGDESWFPQSQDNECPWVFPELERAYLRHANGIELVRRFLDRASSGTLGRGIIGCDSWAWAYLQHIWRGRFSVTLTLQAFDQKRLAHTLHELANGSSRESLLLREASNGHYVLPPADPDAAAGEESDFLPALAAHSRGNLGVAWAIWRASLQSEPDNEKAAEASIDESPGSRSYTVWVRPWKALHHPELPSGSGKEEAFVLHTLMLHNGLALDSMQQCLPMTANQVIATLLQLEETGVVTHTDHLWRVTAQGYPAVRRFLQSGGYLTDAF